MDKSAFFLMIAGVAALAGLVILAFNRPLRAALEDSVAAAARFTRGLPPKPTDAG